MTGEVVKQRTKKVMPVSPGRPAGVPNKITSVVKDAIVMAAEQVGYDGKGKDGLVGYLRDIAENDKKTFAGLVGRVIPVQVGGVEGTGIIVEIIKRVYDD